MTKKVAVIGGGISGLAAAASLVDKGFDVYLLEASDYFGGRLKQVEAFPGFPPVDLGGDFIHGSTNATHNIAKETGWKVKKAYGCDGEPPLASCLYIDGKLYSEQNKEHPDYFEALKLKDDLVLETERYLTNTKKEKCYGEGPQQISSEEQIKGVGLLSWLYKKGANQNVIDIIDSYFCQTHGGTLDSVGVLESGVNEITWKYGSGNYRLEGSYSLFISYLVNTRCAKVDRRLNWPVKEIKWKEKPADRPNQTITIISKHGEELHVNHVIVTVPLTILKDRDILFSPPLPSNKQRAINAIYMGTALKIVCRFQKHFWRETLAAFCPKSFIQQIWTYSRDPTSKGEECHVVVGFETATAAAHKVHLSEKFVCEQFVTQLDEMFGTESDPKPATSSLVDYVYYHWSKHPYIRGGYSSPTVNTLELRHDLAASVDEKLFFAGEATAVEMYATIQAAFGTGERAAHEVCQASGLAGVLMSSSCNPNMISKTKISKL